MEPPPPLIAKLLHVYIPHINISLHKVNSTFDPTSNVYIEVSYLKIFKKIIFYVFVNAPKTLFLYDEYKNPTIFSSFSIPYTYFFSKRGFSKTYIFFSM